MESKFEFEFVIDGSPQRKQRPRFARNGKFVKTYTPQETINYENWIRLCYKQQVHREILDKPLCVFIYAFYQVPQSWSKKKQEKAVNGDILPNNSIDLDNTAKVVLDALNGIAYKDDHKVVNLTISKRYSKNPRVEVSVWSFEEE